MSTYFITAATYKRHRLFQTTRNAELLIETLQHYRARNLYLLHAYVVMPDHIHLLLTPQNTTIERVMQHIKGGFSHKLAANEPIWQPSFTESSIQNTDDYLTRLNYIHQNPIRAHLPNTYAHSSAR